MMTRRELLIAGGVGAVAACAPGAAHSPFDYGVAPGIDEPRPPDLASRPPDLATATDLASSDLAQPNDLTAADSGAADLAQPRDLSPSADGGTCPGTVNAGAVSGIAVGTARLVAPSHLFVCRDAGGYYAMTSICTHQGCDVSAMPQNFTCPCHGSVFDLDGNVMQGPAGTPLRHYALCIDGSGNAIVNPGQVVPSSARV